MAKQKKQKINFTRIEQVERDRNGTIEMWEVYKVPTWIAKRASRIIGRPENGIIETTDNTITWGCATGSEAIEEGWWESHIDGSWANFTEEMDIVDRIK